MLHVCGKSVIIYPVMCNYVIFLFHVIIFYEIFVDILNRHACIDNTVHVLYHLCFRWPSHQFLL